MLSRGMQTYMAINRLMVLVQLLNYCIFVVVGFFYVQPAHWHPYMPFGDKGVLAGAALVFFAYLGFDAVSASAPEVKQPQKTLPRGNFGTLNFANILYVLVAIVLTGMVPFTQLDVADPVAFALGVVLSRGLGGYFSVGALAGMY